MKFVLPVILITTSALASCATTTPARPTPQAYAVMRTALEGSPALRKSIQDRCAMKMTSPQQKQALSLLANVPQDKVQPVVCERLIKAMVSGRLTYDDVAQTRNQHFPTVTAIKVLQGR